MSNSKRPKKSPSTRRPATPTPTPPVPESLRELLAGMFDRVARDNAARFASLVRSPTPPGSSRLARGVLAFGFATLSGAAHQQAQRVRGDAAAPSDKPA